MTTLNDFNKAFEETKKTLEIRTLFDLIKEIKNKQHKKSCALRLETWSHNAFKQFCKEGNIENAQKLFDQFGEETQQKFQNTLDTAISSKATTAHSDADEEHPGETQLSDSWVVLYKDATEELNAKDTPSAEESDTKVKATPLSQNSQGAFAQPSQNTTTEPSTEEILANVDGGCTIS